MLIVACYRRPLCEYIGCKNKMLWRMFGCKKAKYQRMEEVTADMMKFEY